MTVRCKLIVDSCCDLPPADVKQAGVELISLSYFHGEEEFHDDLFQSRTAKDFYDAMRAGVDYTTSQIPLAESEEILTKAVASGIPTVMMTISSGLSGTYNNVSFVLSQLKEKHSDAEVYVYDTKLASIAEGTIVDGAIKHMKEGASARAIVDWAKASMVDFTCLFMVEDLDTLHRGGRIPASVAVVGAKLDVKPMLTIAEDGTLKVCGIARGRKKGIRQLVNHATKNIAADKLGSSRVIVGHADCLEDAEAVKQHLLELAPTMDVLITNIGPVIGSHVGPGMLAISFFKDPKWLREPLGDAAEGTA